MNRGYARCFVTAKKEGYERAIEDFSIALARITYDKLKAECHVKRAYAYWLNGNHERAKADCEQDVIKKTGERIKASAGELLGNIYLKDGEPEKRLSVMKKRCKPIPLASIFWIITAKLTSGGRIHRRLSMEASDVSEFINALSHCKKRSVIQKSVQVERLYTVPVAPILDATSFSFYTFNPEL